MTTSTQTSAPMIDYALPSDFIHAINRLPDNARVLVTGATSGLGRTAISYLHTLGVDCVATGRNAQALDELRAQGVNCVRLDLATASDDDLTALLDGISIIWHCAALSSPWGAYADFYQANTQATVRLATLASGLNVARFVHISTPSLYFKHAHQYNVPEMAVSLDVIPKRSANSYIHTKLLAERALHTLIKNTPASSTQFIILRPRALFGVHDKVLLPRILQLHQKNHTLPLPRGGDVLMDVTFADNVVYAMMLASISPAKANEIPTYNITNQAPIRLNELLYRLIGDAMHLPLAFKSVPYPIIKALAHTLDRASKLTKKEPRLTPYSAAVLYYDTTLDTTLAERELDYHAPYALDTAIAITARALQLTQSQATSPHQGSAGA